MHHTIIQTILALTLVTLCLGTQDNSEVHLLDDNSDFYGFGRSLLQNDGAADEPFIDQSWFGHHRELLAPGSHDSSLPRDRREFYRFGRSQLPFEEKRFLRFGRSVHPSATDSKLHAHDQFKKSLYRRRRSTENGSQSVKLSHHLKRSVQSNDPTDDPKNNQENKIHHKREVSTLNGERDNSVISNDVLGEHQEADKRFMRFGKRFMRFGRGNEDTDEYEKRFMRFGRGNEDNSGYEKRFMRFSKGFDADKGFDKRFMRFGKRFMRFGRGNKDEDNNEKRFMRFGKSVDNNEEPEKRFMRFGKSVDNNEDPEKRFMRFGKSVDYNEEPEKRFMRFGKGMGNNEDPEKRFMRFGKRFMRFGRQGEEHDNQILDLYNDSDDVNAGHLEKSSR